MLETRSPALSTWEYQCRNFDSGLSTAHRDAVVTCREPLAVKLDMPEVAHRATKCMGKLMSMQFPQFPHVRAM